VVTAIWIIYRSFEFPFTGSCNSETTHNTVYIYNTCLREIGWDGVDWIELAQDRDQWRALVNMVINLGVP
jgi:hypothetical protein